MVPDGAIAVEDVLVPDWIHRHHQHAVTGSTGLFLEERVSPIGNPAILSIGQKPNFPNS